MILAKLEQANFMTFSLVSLLRTTAQDGTGPYVARISEQVIATSRR